MATIRSNAALLNAIEKILQNLAGVPASIREIETSVDVAAIATGKNQVRDALRSLENRGQVAKAPGYVNPNNKRDRVGYIWVSNEPVLAAKVVKVIPKVSKSMQFLKDVAPVLKGLELSVGGSDVTVDSGLKVSVTKNPATGKVRIVIDI